MVSKLLSVICFVWLLYYNRMIIDQYIPQTVRGIRILLESVESDMIELSIKIRSSLDNFIEDEWRRRHGQPHTYGG